MSCGRYAPSPTGRLHLGNLRTALLAWLQARLSNGKFILRMDDLDVARCKAEYIQPIIDDLKWLGIDWDEGPTSASNGLEYFQSRRNAFYQSAFNKLHNKHLIYPCLCSRKDIRHALSAPHHNQSAFIYPGTCRPSYDQKAILKSSENTAWRFMVEKLQVNFSDKICGDQRQNLAETVGDFVIQRKEKLFAYHLATVVDDALMGVTSVVRGRDLLDSTGCQIALGAALNFAQPNYWHVPLLSDAQNNRMSKRGEASGVNQWKTNGKSSYDLVAKFAHELGLISLDKAVSCKELLQQLSLDQFMQCLSHSVLAK